MIHYNPEFSGSVTGTTAVISLSGSFTGSGHITLADTASHALNISASGNPNQIQFNDAGKFGASPELYFDTASKDLYVDTVKIGQGGQSDPTTIAIGSASLESNTTGVGNLAIGWRSMQSVTDALINVAVGYNALRSTTSGFGNVAIGSNALSSASYTGLTDGQNVAIGTGAGGDLLTGKNNTILGHGAEALGTGDDNSIVIGHLSNGSGSNTTVIGNANTLTVHPQGVLHIDQRSVYSEVTALPTGVDAGSTVVFNDGTGLKKWFTPDGTNWNSAAISSSYASTASMLNNNLTEGLGIDTFIFNGSTDTQIQLNTSSVHFTTGVSASQAPILRTLSSSVATDIVTNSASIAALSQSSAAERLNYVETSSIIGAGNIIEFTKGDATTYTNTIITSSFVKSVNGILPTPATGNVNTTLTAVDTGTSASMLAASSSGTLDNGQVWIISGETADPLTASNGEAYIFDSASGQLYELSNLDQAENDARYVNKFGDTMTGQLILNADPTLPLGASTKQYVDALSGSASTARNLLALQVSGAFDAVSASLTTTDQTISSSVAALSASASTARNVLALQVSGAFDAVSASLTTTDQTISSSVAALSASASTSRIAVSASLTTTDQTISSSVATLSASAAAALTAQSASNAVDFVSESIYRIQTGSFFTSASISSMTASFTKGDASVSEIYIDTSSYALTASYLEGLSNLTYRENVAGATTYTITHNLGEQYPIVQSYDTATNVMIIPSEVTATNANSLDIEFASAFTGIVVVQR